jgi:hypothetical protein
MSPCTSFFEELGHVVTTNGVSLSVFPPEHSKRLGLVIQQLAEESTPNNAHSGLYRTKM